MNPSHLAVPESMSTLRLVSSDHEWLDRVRQGDLMVFEDAFRAYCPELCAFAFRYLQSPVLAEEVVHDVFMRLWQKRGELQLRESLKAYLYGAVRFRSISMLRKQAGAEERLAKVEREQLAGTAYAVNEGPIEIERRELIDAIERALAELPPRCRNAVILRWQREMSYAEIAEAMGISIKAVEAHLTRAAKRLRTHLPALLPHLIPE
jgi:RNA polymerase sigma-70 factor (ECF subfamily)